MMSPIVSNLALVFLSALEKMRVMSAHVSSASRYWILFVGFVMNRGGLNIGVALSDDTGSGPITVVFSDICHLDFLARVSALATRGHLLRYDESQFAWGGVLSLGWTYKGCVIGCLNWRCPEI